MDKLVITVTTDSTGSYPRNPYLTPCTDARGVAEEYLRALDAGAAAFFSDAAFAARSAEAVFRSAAARAFLAADRAAASSRAAAAAASLMSFDPSVREASSAFTT